MILSEVEQKLLSIINAVNLLAQQLQETRTILEQLGAVSELEYSQNIKEWVLKSKLIELRNNPRG